MDLPASVLRKHGVRLKLQDKPFLILVALLERPREIVSREELHKRLWNGDTFVEFDHNLNNAVAKLREALADSSDAPRFIETLHGRGYRLLVPVEKVIDGTGARIKMPAAVPETSSPSATAPARRIRMVTAVVAAVGLLTVLSWGPWRSRVPSLAFQQRDWVLVSTFENRTGEPLLDGALDYALAQRLSDSRFVNVISRERIEDTLHLMKKPPGTVVNAALGREICLRDGGIRALLTGRADKVGPRYLLDVALVEPSSGATVVTLAEEAGSHDELLPAIGRLSQRIRQSLGENHGPLPQTRQELEKATTRSLRALQLYTQARQLMAGGQGSDAIALVLKQAIAEDPDFAIAHMELALASSVRSEAVAHAAKALALSEKSPDREKYWIKARYHQLLAENYKAIAAYEVLLGAYPDNPEAARSLANVYLQTGEAQEGVKLLARYAEMRPRDFTSVAAAGQAYLVWAGDADRARVYVQRAKSLMDPVEPPIDSWHTAFVEFFPAHDYWLQGNVAKAVEELDRIANTIPGRGANERAGFGTCAGLLYLGLGRFQAAESAFQTIPGRAQRAYLMAALSYARGDRPAMRRQMEEYVSLTRSSAAIALPTHLMIRAGLFSAAEKQLAKRVKEPFSTHHVPALLGQLAMARGRRGEALRLLQQGRQLLQQTGSPNYFFSAMTLAQALEQQGQLQQALEVLELASKQQTRTFQIPRPAGAFWLLAEMELARMHRRRGNIHDAKRVEGRLLKLLSYADAHHPMMEEILKNHAKDVPAQ